eukprot:TRINITY_DN22788_c0_g3_i2.p1 TRINITY_DN22788_c0_g3~~TRINITY_DN22788_c0_g3_i2.p1  ORF type:complete len:745 (+),score=150.35 TRINITY_DN22788_c0_g3_i2:136-2370(+)
MANPSTSTTSNLSRLPSRTIQYLRTATGLDSVDEGASSSSTMGTRTRMGASTRELMQEFSQVQAEDLDDMTPEQLREYRRKQRASRRVSIRETLRCMWRSGKPFFLDRASRCVAWTYSVFIVVLIVVETKVSVWGTDIGANIDNSIKDEDKEEFYNQLLVACGWLAINVPLHMVRRYLVGCFSYEWRRFLTTQILNDYIGQHRAYYRMKYSAQAVDNPDQRIGEDVAGFTQYSVKLLEALLYGAFTIINSAQALYTVSPTLLAFTCGASIILTIFQFGVFGARIMFLQRLVLAQEADLRYGLVRVREHAESIAFYRGEEVERANCFAFFGDCLSTLYRKLNILVLSHGTDKCASGFAMLLPYAMIAPKFFRGEIDFGRIYQSIALFQAMFGATETLVAQLDTMSNVGANAIRVQQFQDTLHKMNGDLDHDGVDDASTAAGASSSSDEEYGEDFSAEVANGGLTSIESSNILIRYLRTDDFAERSNPLGAPSSWPPSPLGVGASPASKDAVLLRLNDVALRVPGSDLRLVSELNLELRTGESLLICGESGSGKSSLLRAIGGLWSSGSGLIERIPDDQCMFLPQEPYVCLGSLRDNMTYPNFEVESDEMMHTMSVASVMSRFTKDVRQAFELAKIDYVLDRHGMDADENFDIILSRGEKQRLCFARVLMRDGINLALLDEATSGVDCENEALLYEQLRETVPCYVSIAHGNSLDKYHTHKLILEKQPQGGCVGRVVRLADRTLQV